MAMDAKDLRIESALGAHSEDGNTKYAQSGTTFQHNGNKPYHDIGSNTLAKVDAPTARPCAIIGPDRVVPPQSTNDAYVKKVPVEPWPCSDNVYTHPPEYPHKPTEYQLSRNISPRQTFQENMQRIMVPPSYASVKNSDDHCLKNPKLTPLESKFCDVPYTISPLNNEPKVVKSSEGLVLSNNSNQPVLPHGWTSSGVNVRPLRPYGAPDLYQYSEYPNCPGPRPISMIRPHRNVQEDMSQVYQDRFHEASIRFKPYPTTKERPLQNPHSRYDYIPNYPNAFQPHVAYPPHKYDLQKSIPTHPYSVYPPVPLKYLERRMPVPGMEKYPRSPGQQLNFNQPFCNQNIPPSYGTLPGNCLQNRAYQYAPDPSKNLIQNRLYFDNNNSRKYYTGSENMYINDINRPPTIKTDLMYPTYPPLNIHSLPPHHMYRKEGSMKGYEHPLHYRNLEYAANMNPVGRVPLQFSPQTMSMSPSDSNTSNDATQILGSVQDDCGYFSQSSTASIRSIESGVNRTSNDIYRRQHDSTLPNMNKYGQKVDTSTSSKDKKSLNVRQFLQMWNEGDDEGNDSNKETAKARDSNNSLGCYDSSNNQEQLYVLGLVNVPKEELAKYEHIQKISKLPENIKGYNSIELLNQYEKLVESPSINHFATTPSQTKQKDIHVPMRNTFPRHSMEVSSNSNRPLSPLDVEAKISQSVIHKEVGCNFEIRPCSPQMMNVEIATPVHNILGERLIEKVVNPIKTKSPLCQRIEETNNISSSRNSPTVTSCKMINGQYPSPHLNDSLKTNYCLQDLESNSGVCLASLPRLDNDIELNFPEINQQFINDNKILPIRDLPILDTDTDGNANNSKTKIQPFISEHLNSGSDSEKDVSKLSKYRKQKRNLVPNENDETMNISQHRTDSVIMKIPENAKTQDECINSVALESKISDTGNVSPMNIVLESGSVLNCTDEKITEIDQEKSNDCKLNDSDTALDFSKNKCDGIQDSSINLSDALISNTETENENDNNIDKLYSPKLSPKIIETDATDNLCILQPKSPTALGIIVCSNILNDNIIPQSIDNDKEKEGRTYETVITHSKCKEMVSDTSSATIASVSEDGVSLNILPSLNNECANVSTNGTAFNNDTSENVTMLGDDIENQALNYCLAEYPGDQINPVCEHKNNLGVEIDTKHDSAKDMDVEINIYCSEKEETISLIPESLSESDLSNTGMINNIDGLTVQEPEREENQIVSFEAVCSEDSTNQILQDVREIIDTQSSTNGTDFKRCDSVDLTNKCNIENHAGKDMTEGNSCVHHTEPIENNNVLIPISMNSFDSTNISSTEIEVFENDGSVSKTDNNQNISNDLQIESEISSSLLDGYSITESIKGHAQLCQIKHELCLNKELFSSRYQNLIIYSEGKCYRNENNEFDSYTNANSDLQPVVALKDSLKLYSEDNNAIPEFNNLTNSGFITTKLEETTNDVTTPSSIGTLECDTMDIKEKLSHSNNINVDLENVQKSTVNLSDTKENNETENFVMIKNDSESLLNVTVTREETYSNSPNNNINVNYENSNQVEEKRASHFTPNEISNKRSRTLKRSLSESAITEYTSTAVDMKDSNDNNFKNSEKRAKLTDSEILVESQVLPENFSNFIQSNRRNSISTIYNDENVSFCIFIDNDCVIAEENESCHKICYTEIPDDCLTTICTEGEVLNSELAEDTSYASATEICDGDPEDSDMTTNIYYENNVFICGKEDNNNSELDSENLTYKEPEECENNLILENMEDSVIDETWVDDVACMETVFSDDIAEDIIISAPSSPKNTESSEDENDDTNFMYNINQNERTNKLKNIYGNKMCEDDVELVEKLFRTPQMNVNKTLIDRESQLSQEINLRYYDNESLEKVLSESNTLDTHSLTSNDSMPSKSLVPPSTITSNDIHGNKENLEDLSKQESKHEKYSAGDLTNLAQTKLSEEKELKEYDECLVHSCESSCDNIVSNRKDEKLQYTISSSPEVSSTTSEEKGPAILLKIRSYKGSKISEVNEMNASFSHTHSHRPLITKAAQKYIPPLKETINDLKVKIRLPKQSLYKLQQLKKSKEEPKIETNCRKLYIKSIPHETLKKAKPKPKFEDVLKSIDEMQYKKHKSKNKKNKQSVPKVIIKKNENGAHYASTKSNETFNPDLTGRKWQPWVFLEKSHFVDKMALKQKFKAIYSHRKKTFVLAENFRKYKSISNAKFVISHPKQNDNFSTGNLKYTFRLKHS